MSIKEKIVVVGAGISGLCVAHELKKNPLYDVTVLEKSSRPGGLLRTIYHENGLFEAGPRGIRLRGQSGGCFMQLIRDLDLQSTLITSQEIARRRYIYMDMNLHEVSESPWKLPFSLATSSLWGSILKEPFKEASLAEDMTLEDFFQERLGVVTYRRLIEPAILGIFGCRGCHLSAKVCFPTLWNYREQHGSVILGALKGLFTKKNDFSYPKIPKIYRRAALISFQNGMQQLVDALSLRLQSQIHLQEPLQSMHWQSSNQRFYLQTPRGEYEANQVILACSPCALKLAKLNLPAQWHDFQNSLPSSSLGLVHLSYKEPIEARYGFGYLLPSSEKQPVLGAVIDSNVFPQHAKNGLTRITVLLPVKLSPSEVSAEGSLTNDLLVKSYIYEARQALTRHLNFSHTPHNASFSLAWQALPIYRPGHHKRQEALEMELKKQKIPLHMTGLGFGSFALTESVLQGVELAKRIKSH